MKNNYSSSIETALTGRSQPKETSILSSASIDTPSTNKTIAETNHSNQASETAKKGNSNKGLGTNLDGTFKQSNAGRKRINKEDKKVQLTLTLYPTTKASLESWASKKPRTAANYVSEYVEEHLEEIKQYFSR